MTALPLDDFLRGAAGPVQPGDVLAFRGTSDVDIFIQEASRSGICHVAILVGPGTGGSLSVLEATGAGITLTALETSLRAYAGPTDHHTCFYLPLSKQAALQVDREKLGNYAARIVGEKYNYAGTIAAGLFELGGPVVAKVVASFKGHPTLGRFLESSERASATFWDKLFESNPRYRRLFCSQLVTGALAAAGVSCEPPWPDPSLVVPVQVCRFPIYRGFYQLNDLQPPLDDPFRWGGVADPQPSPA